VNAGEIKRLGMKVWGGQNGLLSLAELDLLMRIIREYKGEDPRVLEVGHYYGLSTCGIVHALRDRGDDWSMLTLDAHCADSWVGETDPEDFHRNRRDFFDDPRLDVVIARSETLTEALPYHVVFYDGDHAHEQLRFTRLVIDSPMTRLFVFDDRDFGTPKQCCKELVAEGWVDESPTLQRLGGDKRNVDTMTLGVFRREKYATSEGCTS